MKSSRTLKFRNNLKSTLARLTCRKPEIFTPVNADHLPLPLVDDVLIRILCFCDIVTVISASLVSFLVHYISNDNIH
jgi:hypothetical protein